MAAAGPTYSFRSSDDRVFRIRPGETLVVGRRGHGADIEFAELALSGHHARLAHSGGACTLEVLGARGRVLVNGREVGRAGVALGAGDRIGLLGHVYLIVGVEESGVRPAAPDAGP